MGEGLLLEVMFKLGPGAWVRVFQEKNERYERGTARGQTEERGCEKRALCIINTVRIYHQVMGVTLSFSHYGLKRSSFWRCAEDSRCLPCTSPSPRPSSPSAFRYTTILGSERSSLELKLIGRGECAEYSDDKDGMLRAWQYLGFLSLALALPCHKPLTGKSLKHPFLLSVWSTAPNCPQHYRTPCQS